MLADKQSTERIPGYCALCVSRCGSIGVIENGRFVALEPDPSHPTGKALCAKGRAAPELVYHPDRLLYPMKRTRPKGDPDPGWQRISWDEALDLTAANLRRIAAEHGPESVVFSVVSPSTSASDDSVIWIQRLMNAFGSPNLCAVDGAVRVGAVSGHNRIPLAPAVPGAYMPDLENAGCILFWGYNPNLARLSHATATVEAIKRGARLIVVDPRRTGLAKKADLWLQVRPGTDGALALGIAQVMIERGWYDREFIRDWTNGPLLVRADNGRLLTHSDLLVEGSARQYVAWSEAMDRPMLYDPATGGYEGDNSELALFGAFTIETLQGEVVCQPAFELTAELCRRYPPERVEAICGVGRDQVESAARMLWEARPVAYYAWSGVEMQTNSTQIARAIAQLYALTGSFDAPGGNVLFPAVPTANVAGWELLPAEQRAKALGLPERPLGPSRWKFVTTDEIYQGILEQQPYGVHGLVGFGANLLLAHADALRGREALAALDFYVHTDLFMNPTAELADIVLPVASAFEREALKIGFEVSQEAQSSGATAPADGRAPGRGPLRYRDRLRPGAAPGSRRPLLGWRRRGRLSATSSGRRVYRWKHCASSQAGCGCRCRHATASSPSRGTVYSRGFNTPTRKIELYSETMLEHGYPPLPEYEEPLMSPLSRPELAERYPLILTCAKNTLFCESQHRALPSLRRQALDPEVELHPAAAAERGIRPGDWVSIETPDGSVRARARLNDTLKPNVVCGQHGWWQACPEIRRARL